MLRGAGGLRECHAEDKEKDHRGIFVCAFVFVIRAGRIEDRGCLEDEK